MTTHKTYTPDAGVMSSQIISFTLASILVICRLVSRKITHVSLWYDDYFCMLSWVSLSSINFISR